MERDGLVNYILGLIEQALDDEVTETTVPIARLVELLARIK